MKNEKGVFDATVAELRAVISHASDDQSRQHITCVCFDTEKSRIAATDGHRLIVLKAATREPSGSPGQFLVNARKLQAALKGMGGKRTRVRVSCEPGRISLESGNVQATLETTDANFPPIDQVIPEPERQDPARAVKFNPVYLGAVGVIHDVFESQRKRQCGERIGVTIMLSRELEPALFLADFQEEGDATIVVMPMRV